MIDNGATAAASAGRAMSLVTSVLAAVAGLAAASVILGLRVANEGREPSHLNWWLVAWLVVGLVDALAGAALLTHFGHRRLAGCLVIGGLALLVVAVAMQARGYAASLDHPSGWDDLASAQAWGRPVAAGVLAALVPWELAVTGRRPGYEAVWWSTAALIAVLADGEAAGARSSGFDVVDVATWLLAASATAATVRLVVLWRAGARHDDDPLPGWLAVGAVVVWLAFVPERFGIWGWNFPGGDVIGPLLLLATLPVLTVAVLVRALRDRPGRFHGVAHDVIGWLAFSCAIIIVYTGVVAGLGRLVGGNGPTWLLVATTGVIAVFAEPARRRIRYAVDRLVWGARDDPLQVVRGVVDHVGTDSGDELLPALVASLQRELRLDAVAIDVRTPDGWRREAASRSSNAVRASRGAATARRDRRATGRRLGARPVPPCRVTSGCWPNWPAHSASPSDGFAWRPSCGDRVFPSCRPARRSAAVCGATCTTGSVPALTGVSLGLRTAVRQLARSPHASTLTPSRELLDRVADEVDALVIEVKRVVRDLAADGARPARSHRCRRRVHPHLRRRPRVPPDDAEQHRSSCRPRSRLRRTASSPKR